MNERSAHYRLYRFSKLHPILFLLAIAGCIEMAIGGWSESWDLAAFGCMGCLIAIAIWVNRKNPPRPFHHGLRHRTKLSTPSAMGVFSSYSTLK